MIFLNSSVFLAVLLDTEEADRCETILAKVETGELKATTTTHVMEEAAFKLLIAKASETLQTKNLWKMREELKTSEKLRQECYETLKKFMEYVKALCFGGLRIMQVYPEDLFQLAEVFKETGLLTADCLHVTVMKRLNLKKIATLDQDFKAVKGLTAIP